MNETLIADRQYTIERLLDRSGRDTVPLDRRFVQQRVDNNRPAPGPLATFVRRSRESALEQYLVLHATASNNDEGQYDVRLPAATWGRVIGAYFDPETGVVDDAGLHAVSRNWSFLKKLKLVETQRISRRTRAWLLADDGTGDPYQHPGENAQGKKLADGTGYIQLPYAYWRDRWHEKLSLRAKAMLLIAMTLGDGFPLPAAQLPGWYGISESTCERGLGELHEAGLLHRERHRRPEVDSPVGFADVYHYELRPPFGPRGVMSSAAPPGWVGPGLRTLGKGKATAKRRAKGTGRAKPSRAKARRAS
jgi:hypothetical protein